ncbi:MAG: site-2 protease family protein [Thermodesulfobacteriota bacterium]
MFESYVQRLILLAPPILLALTFHECAHAATANRLGDPTAKMLGRVTLNPLRHLDPIGTLALFFSGMFGWAKPVPVNPRNFRHMSRDMMFVALAGPLSNLVLAALSAVVYKLAILAGPMLLVRAPGVFEPVFIMIKLSILINVSLAVFNLIPVPPLDGSKVLAHLLPPSQAFAFSRLEPYGFMILMVLIISGVVNTVVSPLVFLMVGVLTGGVFI